VTFADAQRVADAKSRLEALKQPVPTPTPEAIAQNKAEEESRRETGMWGRAMLTFRKRPDMAQTARVGEPTLVDPRPTNAPEIVRHAGDVLSGKGDQQLSIEQVGTGTPPANAPVPRSDAQGGANAPQADSNAAQQVDPNAPQSTPPQQDDGIQSLTPMAPAQTPAAPQQTPPTQTPG
jgi:outer membrane protein assembly factor BamD